MAINKKTMDKYKELAGKQISYMGKYRNCQAVTTVNDGQETAILIVCESEQLNVKVPEERAADLVDEFIEIGSINPDKKDQSITTFQQEERKQIQDLANIMMNNIKEVQKDKTYIPQAKVVTNSVNTMINMAKLKLQLEKQTRE